MRSEHLHATHHDHAADVVIDLEAREAVWEFAPGKTVPGWTYNGQVPGPTIEARVGDSVVVRFTNALPEPTLIHWHGLQVPASMDGTDIVQRPVAPGETFEYRFVVPDAGTFWYHSHRNETVQMERGLYGALVVRGTAEPVVDREQVLVLDDLSLNQSGGFAKFGGRKERHDGREGSVRLLNGRAEPELMIAAGQTERWRIVNAASARYVLLSFDGKEFRMLASSGGLLETPMATTAVLLTPGDRVDIAIGPFEEGETISVESLPYDRHAGRKRVERFGTILVGPLRPSTASIPDRLRTIEPLAASNASPTRRILLSGQASPRGDADFLINGEVHHTDKPVTVGELQIWEIVNASQLDHPFHLHGFFFQVLSENGTPPAFRSWEDTVNVPANGGVTIAWMPDDRPGGWMYHCHILEHHAAGMMAHFAVVRPGESLDSDQLAAISHHHH